MVFSSIPFLHLFLPLALLAGLGAHAAGGARLSNPALLAASLIFYAASGVGAAFAPILLLSIAANFALGSWASASRRRLGRAPRGPIIAAVAVNLALLGYFKYANFLVAETQGLRAFLGFEPVVWESVVLPIGISFFTFQAMSYVFDVAKGDARALRNPFDFALYIVLFPQLIAGPIVRFATIAEKLRERSVTLAGMREGAVRFVHGLVKKVVIADSAGAVADLMFDLPGGELTAGAAWLGAFAYAVQIYFDFSGYSDMAIGLGRMFGFVFPENFNRPYAALSVTDFWRRWHITLSSWFRDYVYIPLGGSRRSPARTYANLWAVFILTGVWHGANWTFLLWGAYHGALLAGERAFALRAPVANDGWRGGGLTAARRAATFLLVLFGWVLFRSQNVHQATGFYAAMASFADLSLPPAALVSIRTIDLFFMGAGACLALLAPSRFRGAEAYAGRRARVATAALMLVAFPYALLKVAAGSYSPFLYFQF